MLTAKVEGGEKQKLIKRLESLQRKIAGKILRQALRAGAKVFQAAYQANYPRRSGRTARKLTVRAGKRSRKGPSYRVLFRDPDELVTTTAKGTKHFPPAVIEYGTATREALAPGRRAFDEKHHEAQRVVAQAMKAGIAAAAAERS